MRNKHNKKRNTAFIYESLMREMTACVLKKDSKQKENILSLIKKHFNVDGVLYHDLKNYRALYENQNLDKNISEKILVEAKISSRMIDPDKLFDAQTDLINDVNKQISPTVFNTFVPNYKTLATIHQIFSPFTEPKSRVILEAQLVDNMCNVVENNVMENVDSLTLNRFIDKFNEKYGNKFHEEQKTLLNNYITSFVDNGLGLKIYLNEELSRLKVLLEDSKTSSHVSNDKDMIVKIDLIRDEIGTLEDAKLDEQSLFTVLKTQELVKEIFEDVSQN